MRSRTVAALSVPLVLTTIMGAHAAADARKEVQAGYDKLVQAMKHKDLKAIMAVGTPDFTEQETPNGPVRNAKQVQQVFETEFKMVKSYDNVSMKVGKLDVKGDTAVATTDYTFAATVAGQKPGETHKMTGTGTTRDTWIKTKSGWKCKNVRTLKATSLMDGKPMAMMPPPKPAARPMKLRRAPK